MSSSATSLSYEEPSLIVLLNLGSFLVGLIIFRETFHVVFGAGLLGQFTIGLLYGIPVANILPDVMQEAIQMLGYLVSISAVITPTMLMASSGTYALDHRRRAGDQLRRIWRPNQFRFVRSDRADRSHASDWIQHDRTSVWIWIWTPRIVFRGRSPELYQSRNYF